MPILIQGRPDGRWKPQAGSENQRYPWNVLAIGESFVTERRLPHEMRPMANAAGKKYGLGYEVLGGGLGSRVRRIS